MATATPPVTAAATAAAAVACHLVQTGIYLLLRLHKNRYQIACLLGVCQDTISILIARTLINEVRTYYQL